MRSARWVAVVLTVAVAACARTPPVDEAVISTTVVAAMSTTSRANVPTTTTTLPPPGPDIRGVLQLVPDTFMTRLERLQATVESQLSAEAQGDSRTTRDAAHEAGIEADRLKSDIALALDRLLGPSDTNGRQVPPTLTTTNNLFNALYDLVWMERALDEWHGCVELSSPTDCLAEAFVADGAIDGRYPTRLVDYPAISAQFLSDARRAR